jgi:hypothetical protein
MWKAFLSRSENLQIFSCIHVSLLACLLVIVLYDEEEKRILGKFWKYFIHCWNRQQQSHLMVDG